MTKYILIRRRRIHDHRCIIQSICRNSTYTHRKKVQCPVISPPGNNETLYPDKNTTTRYRVYPCRTTLKLMATGAVFKTIVATGHMKYVGSPGPVPFITAALDKHTLHPGQSTTRDGTYPCRKTVYLWASVHHSKHLL